MDSVECSPVRQEAGKAGADGEVGKSSKGSEFEGGADSVGIYMIARRDRSGRQRTEKGAPKSRSGGEANKSRSG